MTPLSPHISDLQRTDIANMWNISAALLRDSRRRRRPHFQNFMDTVSKADAERFLVETYLWLWKDGSSVVSCFCRQRLWDVQLVLRMPPNQPHA